MTDQSTNKPTASKWSLKARFSTFILLIALIVLGVNSWLVRNVQALSPLVENQLSLISEQTSQSAQHITLIANQQTNIERVHQINRAINLLNETTYWYFQGALTLVTASLDSGREKHAQLLRQINEMSQSDAESTAIFSEVINEAESFQLYAERMFTMFDSNSVSMGKSMSEGAKLQANKVLTLLNALRDQYVAEQANSMAQISQGSNAIKRAGEAAYHVGETIGRQVDLFATDAKQYSVALLIVILGLGLVSYRILIKPIIQLSMRFRSYASLGELRPIEPQNDAELGDFILAYNLLIERLDSAQQTIEHNAQLLDSVMTEHSDREQGGAKNTGDVTAEFDSVAIATHQLAESAEQIKVTSDSAAELGTQATEVVKLGQQIIFDSVESLHQLTDRINHSTDVVAELAKNTDEIGSVLSVISGISEQTNLLALNAAIEAARAGDQGRGFAVVADEVRNLASRTQQSTVEIQQTVQKLQQGAELAVQEMAVSRASSEQNREYAQQVQGTIAQVAQLVEEMQQLCTQMAQTTMEQSTVVDRVGDSMQGISERLTGLKSHTLQLDQMARDLSYIREQYRRPNS